MIIAKLSSAVLGSRLRYELRSSWLASFNALNVASCSIRYDGASMRKSPRNREFHGVDQTPIRPEIWFKRSI